MPGTGAKGFALEERLRAYFWEAGYFALRGIPFQIGDLEVTDIDIWLYERPAAAARRRMIVDIKNKKRSKAVERIIWAQGLASVLKVDNAIVAAKDSRLETFSLAKKADVIFFGSAALKRIEESTRLTNVFALSEDDLLEDVRRVDVQRKSKNWLATFDRVKRSLVEMLGEGSLNKALSAFCYFANQAIEATPGSPAAITATRLSQYSASLALLSIDYLMAGLNFASLEERGKAIENAVRYGTVGGRSELSSVKVGLGLISSYAPNGQSVAAEVERRFIKDADSINAEIIAELVRKMKVGSVFAAARELQASVYSPLPLTGEALSIDARATLGALLDYCEADRRSFFGAMGSAVVSAIQATPSAAISASDGQTLLTLDPPTESP